MGTQGSHLLWVLIFLPVNAKCLLKEFSSSRRGGVPWGDILFSHWVRSPTTTPLHSLPLSEHRLTLGQPRSAFPIYLRGTALLPHRPDVPLLSSTQNFDYLLSAPVALNGRMGRSGVQQTIHGVGKNRADWESSYYIHCPPSVTCFLSADGRWLLSLWLSSLSARREKIKEAEVTARVKLIFGFDLRVYTVPTFIHVSLLIFPVFI